MGTPTGERNANERPLYGQRLLPQLLDQRSKTTPNRIYASYAYSVDISQGFRDVTFQEMAGAIDFFAWWIHRRHGRSNKFESLAYMGIPDLRTPIIFIAAVKCGYKVSGTLDLLHMDHETETFQSCYYSLNEMPYQPTYHYWSRQDAASSFIQVR